MAFSWNVSNWFKNNLQQLQDALSEVDLRNPVAQIFSRVGNDIEEAVSMRSVVTLRDTLPLLANSTFLTILNNMLILPVYTDKQERIKQYRSIAQFTECSWCLDEICDDFIHEDENKQFIKLILPAKRLHDGDLNEFRKGTLEDEFKRYINLFNLREDGYNLVRRFLIEGELAFENIISPNYVTKGIIGVKFLPAEYYETLMNLKTGRSVGIFFNTDRFLEDIKMILSQSCLGSQQVFNQMMISSNANMNTDTCIPLLWPLVTYISSGEFSPDGLVCFSMLEKCRQAYHQLVLLQDAAVIRRVTRAPERLLFNVSTGRMTLQYAEAYVRNFANGLKSKKVVGENRADGRPDIASVYNPVSMLESYIFAKSDANDGTTIESVGSSENYEEMGDVEYFLRRLLKQFKIPFSRYKTPENVAERDETISYEEYAFSRMIIRFLRRFALGLKKGFITDLKLRGIWDKFDLAEDDIEVVMTPPVLYDLYQTLKLVAAKMDTYKAVVDQEEFSKITAMKKLLGMTDEEIEDNFKNLTKEKQLVQLADYYAEQLNSEGPATFDSPIPIKGKTDKDPNEQDLDAEGGDEGAEGEEGSGEEGGSEGGEESSGGEESGESGEEESGGGEEKEAAPSFGLGN